MALECAKCGAPKVPPSQRRFPSGRCSRCMNGTEAGKRARSKYQRRSGNKRMIRICDRYYGYAKTPELAEAIKAYARSMLNRYDTMAANAGYNPTEAKQTMADDNFPKYYMGLMRWADRVEWGSAPTEPAEMAGFAEFLRGAADELKRQHDRAERLKKPSSPKRPR